jgi:hypothetical protein
MKQNYCLYSQKLRRIKKYRSAVLILSIITFLAAGCSSEGISQNSTSPMETKDVLVQEKKSSQEQSLSSDKNAETRKAEGKTTTDRKLEEITKQMDKMDASLKELDDSNDISNSETLINNIN